MAHVLSHKASRPAPKGLRRLRLWVPDTRDAAYQRHIKAQCVALRNDTAEQDVLAWTEAAVHDIEGWR